MNGHRTPRRVSAGPDLPPSRRDRCSHSPILLLVLMLALLLAGSLAVGGCGSDESATTVSETSTTVASVTTTAAPEETSTTEASPAESAFPVTVTDDNGNSVTVVAEPQRIVSTVPANTETLFALGVGDRVVGVTSLCDYPPEVAGIDKIGDYQTNTEAVMALSPDLVLGYAGNEEPLVPVQNTGCPVLIFNPTTLDGVYANILMTGDVTGTAAEAAALVESIKTQVKEIGETAAATGNKPRVFYALDNTLWTAGPGSFVDEMLSLANCVNIGSAEVPEGAAGQPYYQLTPEQLVAANPDVILLPLSSGYANAEEFMSDPRFTGLTAIKEGQVFLFDDKTVTRPGPRIGGGLEILAAAIHPGAF